MDNVPKGSNEQRIRELERQVMELQRKNRSELQKLVAQGQIRFAKVVDSDDEAGTSNVIWQLPYRDPDTDELELVDRSATQQGVVNATEVAAAPEYDQSGMAAVINGAWYWIGGDPDTPFRQTVETSIADLKRGNTAPIFGDPGDLTIDALNLHSQGGGASTANGLAHGEAISAGTLGFFNEDTGTETPIKKKTSDGGFAPAIIYLLNENHEYAVCDSRLAQPADQRFLISTPYGPYRIVTHQDLDPEVTEVPKFVNACIKDQTQDRDVSFYTLYPGLYYDSGNESYDLKFASWEAASSAASDGRHIFPELALDSPKMRIERKWFEEDAPVPLYIYRLYLHGTVERIIGSVSGTNYFNEVLFEFSDTTPAVRKLRYYNRINGYTSSKILGIETVFRRYDNSEFISSRFEPINLPDAQVFDPPAASGFTTGVYQTWSTIVTGIWEENFKDVRFRIKTNGSSAAGMDTELKFGGPDWGDGSTVWGYLLLFRLGDRGAHPNAGSRTLSGFTTVVSEPEPP